MPLRRLRTHVAAHRASGCPWQNHPTNCKKKKKKDKKTSVKETAASERSELCSSPLREVARLANQAVQRGSSKLRRKKYPRQSRMM
jgi:hypothetical protein